MNNVLKIIIKHISLSQIRNLKYYIKYTCICITLSTLAINFSGLSGPKRDSGDSIIKLRKIQSGKYFEMDAA